MANPAATLPDDLREYALYVDMPCVNKDGRLTYTVLYLLLAFPRASIARSTASLLWTRTSFYAATRSFARHVSITFTIIHTL
jgi:hypothetical protein